MHNFVKKNDDFLKIDLRDILNCVSFIYPKECLGSRMKQTIPSYSHFLSLHLYLKLGILLVHGPQAYGAGNKWFYACVT